MPSCPGVAGPWIPPRVVIRPDRSRYHNGDPHRTRRPGGTAPCRSDEGASGRRQPTRHFPNPGDCGASPWEGGQPGVIVPLLNYLTSKPDGHTMASRRKGGGPDACGILANLWRLIQSVLDDSEAELEALGLSPKAFFLLEAV